MSGSLAHGSALLTNYRPQYGKRNFRTSPWMLCQNIHNHFAFRPTFKMLLFSPESNQTPHSRVPSQASSFAIGSGGPLDPAWAFKHDAQSALDWGATSRTRLRGGKDGSVCVDYRKKAHTMQDALPDPNLALRGAAYKNKNECAVACQLHGTSWF